VIILNLNDGFDDKSPTFQDVEHFRLLPDVKYDVIWLIFDLIELLVEFNQVNKAPVFKERETLQKLLPPRPLKHLYMLIFIML
jgi:hypothetical protein